MAEILSKKKLDKTWENSLCFFFSHYSTIYVRKYDGDDNNDDDDDDYDEKEDTEEKIPKKSTM